MSSTNLFKPTVTDEERFVLVAMVCQSMADGLSMRKACKAHGVLLSNFYYWVTEHPDLAKQYARARDLMFAHWQEDILEISDEQQEGVISRDTPQGMTIERKDVIEHRKLRISTRQWLLSKLKPERYGDKMQLGGADDLPPISTNANITLSPEDAYKQMIGGKKK